MSVIHGLIDQFLFDSKESIDPTMPAIGGINIKKANTEMIAYTTLKSLDIIVD